MKTPKTTLAAYLLFLCAIPFGDTALIPHHPWLTATKLTFLFLLAAVGGEILRGWRPRVRVAFLVLGGALLCGALLSTLGSSASASSAVFFLRLGGLTVFGWITAAVVTEAAGAAAAILTTLFGVAATLSLLGIYQTLSGHTLGTLGFYEPFGRLIDIYRSTDSGGAALFRASATFDHPYLFGAFLLGALPYGMARFIAPNRTVLATSAFGSGIVVCLIALVFTFSRGAWLGLLAIAAAFGLWRAGRFRLGLLAGLSVLLAAALLSSSGRELLWARGGTVQSYDAGRLFSFHTAWRMMIRHPFLGVGLEQFDRVYRDYAAPGEVYHQNPLHRMDAHNTWLDIGAEGGLAMLAPFAGLALALGIHLRRKWRAADGLRALQPAEFAVMAGLLGLLAQSLTHSLEYQEILWLMVGIGFAGLPPAPVRAPEKPVA
jgi:O-antigen ligase